MPVVAVDGSLDGDDAPLGAGAFEFKLWFLDFLQNLPPDPAKDETT